MENKFRNVVAICGVFMALTACNESSAKSEYEKNVAALEKTCSELTANDPDGRKYEPIVGRFLGSKMWGGGPPSHSDSVSSFVKIYLESKSNEFGVMIAYPMRQGKEFYELLSSIVGAETIQDERDTVTQFGICANQSKKNGKYINSYTGLINTFRKVGE